MAARLTTFLLASALVLQPSAAAAEDIEEQERSTIVQEIEQASNASLLWGPYKPNLYFGVTPRIPQSLAAGLLWARVEDFQTVQNSELSFSLAPIAPA